MQINLSFPKVKLIFRNMIPNNRVVNPLFYTFFKADELDNLLK